MISKALFELLNQLQLVENEAVFFRDEKDGKLYDAFSFDIKKNLNTIQPDAFFVFNKQPLILFFDFTNEKKKTEKEKRDEAEIHKKVYSFDISPVIFILKNDEIKVYNALNYNNGLNEISLKDNEKIEQFSFWKLQSGETLEWFYNKYKKTLHKKRVHQQLFENIKQAILLLKDQYHLDEKVAKLLVLRLIFCRYLIDRKIRIDKKYINEVENEVINRRRLFGELIANPKKLQDFFIYLNERFNGVLFEKDSLVEITQNQANILSVLFDPYGINKNQLHFDFQFDVFDFGIIPVELISGIYETLLDEETKNSTSAVYTPPFLVDYILTKTVDTYFEKNENSSKCKVFDPAMGSGIFLVQSLRRMIEREKINNPNEDNDTFGKRIKEIAENNLFGIDINEEAINVACFSIYIALLDYQEPGDISVYKFPTLRDTNFYKVHFFDLNKTDVWTTIKNKKIDFILGNPPWKNNSSIEHLDWLKQSKFDKIVSDKQIAQSYLIRVKDFVESHTKVALIVTSKIYYNNKATKFKDYFLKNNLISEVFDLSPVRHLIFETAKSPAAILFFKVNLNLLDENSNNLVKHISLKQNRFFNKFTKALVIEKFDQKEILQKYFVENDWMFKVALYGNTLDFVFLKRLTCQKSTIKTYLDLIKDKSPLHYGDGIKKYTQYSINKLMSKKSYSIEKHPKPFNEISEIPIIETDSIKQYFVNPINTNLPKKEDLLIKSGRDLNLYKGKKIIFSSNLIKETEIAIPYVENDAVYREKTLGLTIENNAILKEIYAVCLSNIYTYFQYLITSNWGVYYSQILQVEYLSFPYIEPEPSETQKKQLIKLVDTFLQPFKDYYSTELPNKVLEINNEALNQINAIIEEIYQVKPYEKDLINYVLEVSRYQFQEKQDSQDRVTSFSKFGRNKEQILRDYAEIYLQEFGKIYDDCFFKVEVYELDAFITMQFIIYDEKPNDFKPFEIKKEVNNEKQLFEKLSTLSISQLASSTNNENNLFIQKDLKGFEESSFYIIKPKDYKCWHRAMAWYDVAEFREAILKAELEHFKDESE